MVPLLDYQLFGLRIRSSIELPTLHAIQASEDSVDVVVRTGAVPERLPASSVSTTWRDFAPGELLLRITNVGRYLIRNGREITVEPAEAADPRAIELFLLGSALGALCQQRGLLPLHASAVDIGGKCVAFTGASGAGKSTMAAYLAGRGYPLVCDDVCVVTVDETSGVRVAPSDPRVKLWSDGLESMHISTEGLAAVRAETTKYHVPVHGVLTAEPLPLAAVYTLAERGDQRSIDALQGFGAMLTIAAHTYRGGFIEPLGLARDHFQRCGVVARTAKIRKLTRPRGFEGLARTAEDLERDWRTMEKQQ